MPAVARRGDRCSHGGTIVTGSPTGTANGSPIARRGDTYACPIHGPNPIIEGSSTYSVDGKPVACVGDRTECGATIVSGSPNHFDQ